MSPADPVVVAVVLLALAAGWASGLSRTVGGLAGLVGGLLAGSWLAARVSPAADGLAGRLLLEAGCLLAGALVGGGVGGRLGSLAGSALRRAGLRRPEQVAGAVLGAAAATAVCWVLAGALLAFGPAAAAAAVRSSAVLDVAATVLPERTDATRALVRALRVPSELTGLVPAGPTAGPPESTVSRVSRGAAGSVVAVTAAGCGTSTSEGSGFYAATGLVLTNAHVVAGQPAATVTDAAGTHRATVVGFDPVGDVAVLRVTGSHIRPLPMHATAVGNGSAAVVVGHPGGGPLRAVPAVVVQQLPVLDRRIGGAGLVTRAAYRIRAVVRPGNSGGPLLDTSGRVIGIVNARSLLDDDSGFALTLATARTDLAAAASAQTAVSTGGCTAAAPH